MNLWYAQISEVFVEDGMRMGKVRVGGAKKIVPLDLAPDATCGDTILLCDGVAISKTRKDANHVPGNPR